MLSIMCNQPMRGHILAMLRTVEDQHKELFSCQLEVGLKAVCFICLELDYE